MPPGPTNGQIFGYELMGTAMLLLLGCGVVANVALAKTKGNGGGFLMVNFGWGLAVFAGVYVAFKSGAHLNPAVSIAMLVNDTINFSQFLIYVAAQMLGAIIGAALCWAAAVRGREMPAWPKTYMVKPEQSNPAGVDPP